MGLVLSLLTKKKIDDIYIDFESAKPSTQEMKVYTMVEAVLKKGEAITKAIEEYKGCTNLVTAAVKSPTSENETAAFKALSNVADDILNFYDFSKTLEQMFPILLNTISQPDVKENKQTLESQQALVKQLADVFAFALHFDGVRMTKPMLSNDFSYYRRLLPKFANDSQITIKIKDDQTGPISFFSAQHIPMMTSLCTATQKALEKNEHVTNALSAMANACYSLLERKKFEKKATNLFIARAMTGSIILFDHVDSNGAFYKKSPINIKDVVGLLKKNFSEETSLLAALQFSSKTFKTAPDSIQSLFTS
eukprot:TRINITY_DN1226_c0_g1_i1.p1 TRINITY_DN1226_c0_g1~~TRINITY_DN1226_c0_g1_i1.p1  ORF type:complete len:308 (+),score=73.98 TRINITY_DN1226_c0_g1_i1:83-1006(+)